MNHFINLEVALNSDDFETMKVDLCNIFDHKLVVGEDINSHFSRLGIPSNICEVLDSRSLPIPMGYQAIPLRYRNPMENAIRAMQLFTNYAQMRVSILPHFWKKNILVQSLIKLNFSKVV